jgi:hypothetical protein
MLFPWDRRFGLAKLVVLKKGGGGRVAVNPEMVTHVRSAAGAFTDIFVGGQQIAIEGTFEEVVHQLAAPARRAEDGPPAPTGGQRGLTFQSGG